MMKNRMFMLLFLLVCVLSLFTACKSSDNIIPGDNNITGTASPTDSAEDISPTAEVLTGENFSLVTIRFYTVNVSNMNVKTSTAMEASDTVITPQIILDYVLDSLEDDSIYLSVESVDFTDGECIINFDDSIYSISSQGAELEYAILDAIAQSILDNVEGCKSICYRIQDKAYVTDNISFGFNDVYMDN